MSSSISGISDSLLQTYIAYQNKSTLTTADMFNTLSKTLGGDGTSITKDQLDKYVSKLESDSSTSSDLTLNSLKSIQDDWKKISNGKDSITAADMADYSSLLLSFVSSGISNSANATTADSTAAAYSTLINSALSSSSSSGSSTDNIYNSIISAATNSNSSGNTKDQLTTYLKGLISSSSDEYDNSDTIDLVLNLIADYQSQIGKTVDVKA